MKKDHQKAKADENNQSHQQKSAHHGEVILSRTMLLFQWEPLILDADESADH